MENTAVVLQYLTGKKGDHKLTPLLFFFALFSPFSNLLYFVSRPAALTLHSRVRRAWAARVFFCRAFPLVDYRHRIYLITVKMSATCAEQFLRKEISASVLKDLRKKNFQFTFKMVGLYN